jgi:membrane protease YdiL (CAAX protease family)
MGSALLWTVALFLASMLIVPPVVTVISDALNFPAQHLEVFARLRGNPALYLVLLIPVSWGSAAFGEELICRGFILRRLCDALGGGRGAQLGAVLGQAALFGCAHAYLGPRGMLNAGALGLLAGLCYLMNGRNLWPLILAHGLVDTVGMTVLFLGLAHG